MPNVLLIMSDQHNARFMGCAGHPVIRTPALDALAAGGSRFSAAYCPHPLCVPSRMAFLTGQQAGDVDSWGNGSVLDSSVPTFAHAFAAGGWEPILCGRMHFEGPDQFHGFTRRLYGDCSASLTKEIEGQGRNRTNGQTRYAAQVAGHGQTGFHAFDREVARRAVNFFRQRGSADRPFCLVVGLMLPHNPLICRRELFEEYMDRLPPLDLSSQNDLQSLHPAIRAWRTRRGVDEITAEQHRRALAAYFGLVTEMDENVTAVLDALRASPFADDTLVIYCSDHGDQAGEHGLWWKSSFYDGSVRIPLIFQQRGQVPAGRTIDNVVSLIDVGPTLLDLLGAPAMPGVAGRSLAPLLAGQATDWPDEAFSEYAGDHGDKPSCMLRRGRWKLIYFSEFDSCLLFDMQSDPGETRNRAGDPAHSAVRDELLAAIHARWSPERMTHGIQRSRERWKIIQHEKERGPHPVEHHHPAPEDNQFDFAQLPQPPQLM